MPECSGGTINTENMARPERFELPTKWFEATYSIQLSYGRVEESQHSKLVHVLDFAASREAQLYSPPHKDYNALSQL